MFRPCLNPVAHLGPSSERISSAERALAIHRHRLSHVLRPFGQAGETIDRFLAQTVSAISGPWRSWVNAGRTVLHAV